MSETEKIKPSSERHCKKVQDHPKYAYSDVKTPNVQGETNHAF